MRNTPVIQKINTARKIFHTTAKQNTWKRDAHSVVCTAAVRGTPTQSLKPKERFLLTEAKKQAPRINKKSKTFKNKFGKTVAWWKT